MAAVAPVFYEVRLRTLEPFVTVTTPVEVVPVVKMPLTVAAVAVPA